MSSVRHEILTNVVVSFLFSVTDEGLFGQSSPTKNRKNVPIN